MDREKQIERMEGAEHRATAFFDRCLSTPLARAILKRGNPDRPKAPPAGPGTEPVKPQ